MINTLKILMIGYLTYYQQISLYFEYPEDIESVHRQFTSLLKLMLCKYKVVNAYLQLEFNTFSVDYIF